MNTGNPYRTTLLITSLAAAAVALSSWFLGVSMNNRGQSIEDLQAGAGFISFGQQAFWFAVLVAIAWVAVSAVNWRPAQPSADDEK